MRCRALERVEHHQIVLEQFKSWKLIKLSQLHRYRPSNRPSKGPNWFWNLKNLASPTCSFWPFFATCDVLRMYNRLILPQCLSGRSNKIKRRWWDGEIKGYHRISDIAVYRIWWAVSWNCDVASSNWNRHISIYLVTIEVHWTRSPISINVSGSLVASISRRSRYQGSLATWMKRRHGIAYCSMSVCTYASKHAYLQYRMIFEEKKCAAIGVWNRSVAGAKKRGLDVRRVHHAQMILVPLWSFSESCGHDNVKQIQANWPCNNAYLNSYLCKFTFTGMFFLFFLSSFMPVVGPGQVPGLEVAQSQRRMRGIEMGCIGLQDFKKKPAKDIWSSWETLLFPIHYCPSCD